LYREKP
jgi:myb proto-oncogene protein